MHFAMPPRKTSHPPPYARAFRSSPARSKRVYQLGGLILCGILLIIFLGSNMFKPGPERAPPGTPEIVLVTTIDEEIMSKKYIEKLKENREYYAEKQGYGTFYANASSYDLNGSPRTWAQVPGMRHALAEHPHSSYFFYLSPHAVVMDTTFNIKEQIIEKKKLESLMLRDKPVVPPDSVIKTFAHLKGDKIDFIVTQDFEGLCQGSFIMKQGDWAKFFLDTWFDPLYRSYNFQKAEGHALEHIVQWHPTILTKLALIPFRSMNTYNVEITTRGGKEMMYRKGDWLVRLVGCELDTNRDCEKEFNKQYDEYKLQRKKDE